MNEKEKLVETIKDIIDPYIEKYGLRNHYITRIGLMVFSGKEADEWANAEEDRGSYFPNMDNMTRKEIGKVFDDMRASIKEAVSPFLKKNPGISIVVFSKDYPGEEGCYQYYISFRQDYEFSF